MTFNWLQVGCKQQVNRETEYSSPPPHHRYPYREPDQETHPYHVLSQSEDRSVILAAGPITGASR